MKLRPSLDKTYGKPTPLTLEEINELISRFAWAAEVLAKAGADGIIVRILTRPTLQGARAANTTQLHGSHGYLLNQFLSPLTKHRTDKVSPSSEPPNAAFQPTDSVLQYGGTIENRARFILDVVNAIKAKLPSSSFVIGVKFSCHDCMSTRRQRLPCQIY